MKNILILIISFLILNPAFVKAGFWESFQKIIKENTSPSKEESLTETDLNKGLKELLLVALKRTVDKTGQDGGFLNNELIRIPPPAPLDKATNFMRKLGFEKQADDFEISLNQAAEKAVKEAWPIFLETAKSITLQDVKNLFNGGEHAVTNYFREKTWPKLYQKFLPIVRENLNRIGVTQKYQQLISSPTIKSYLGYLDQKNLELDKYVTEKSLEGLFTVLAQEEERIRKDPAARTTELLKKLFKKATQN
ncbi:DUF4197 domain-containing protein [Thermodesulfatator autotrophicus]|uniref:DUF4197 domain-containing protein n=1 Tax=Thermodesulfatator autotrophicus TaxID=1795632 RepID=A0A177EBE3_9BACT|nr:DUF4197 domain-containing protein [Thermodesulfatator autotrophicus]OAG28720.1 hypothetical protein TH606_00195 [Thermodesulfatator autotrophicus]